MTREEKRKISIIVSIVGVVLLLIVVLSSVEFRKKVKENKALSDVVEITVTKAQKEATKYISYNVGLKCEEARDVWQRVINKKFGDDCWILGAEKCDEGTIIFGNIVYSPWILLMNDNGEIVWIHEGNDEFEDVEIRDVFIRDGVITAFACRNTLSESTKKSIIMLQYTRDGKQITNKTIDGIQGDINYIISSGDKYYLCLDERYLINDSICEVNADGTCKKLWSCVNEDKMVRYFVEDMTVKDNKLYISAISIEIEDSHKVQNELSYDLIYEDEDNVAVKNKDGEYYIYHTKDELEQIRNVYSATLLEYSLADGGCKELDRKEKRVASKVSISDDGELVWRVGNIFTGIKYGHFHIITNTKLTEYHYDDSNILFKEEALDEIDVFIRKSIS